MTRRTDTALPMPGVVTVPGLWPRKLAMALEQAENGNLVAAEAG